MKLTPIEAAAAQEFEYYGSTLTTNTALKIALLIMASLIGLLGFALERAAVAAANQKPLIIRVNEVGNAEAIAYRDFTYKPQAPEIRYFLTRFVTGYYSRNHQTVREKYVDSLYFLDRELFGRVDAIDRRTQWLPKFESSPENDANVTVNNVVIEDLEKQPYRARVEFTKVFTTMSGAESKRESWAAEILFRINPDVPNRQVLHNPLGIAVTFFRADQAFSTPELETR
jgi:type IV secretory pathway TrbF-like protein